MNWRAISVGSAINSRWRALLRVVRVLGVGWAINVKILSRSAFDGLLAVTWPLFFATIAFFMFRAGASGTTLLYASIGSSVMGVWTATSVASSNALQRQRWEGTFEILVAAPVHFSLVLLPITIAMSTVGVYAMAATLAWGRLLFGIGVDIEHPVLFVLAVPATIVSIGMLGFLLSVAIARYRRSWAIGYMFEYPVWLICGFLVPLTLLPGWVRPIAWVLAPTWGVRAIREASLGGDPAFSVSMCLALGAAYTLVGVALVEVVLRQARERATLSLT